MPLKFCNHRWLENVTVCERSITLLPAIRKYVAAVISKRCTDPGTKSFGTVSECLKDPLFPAKLASFLSIAKLLQPFLATFQTDAPMIPFLYAELLKLMKAVMERFVKADILSSATSFHSIDVAEDKNSSPYNNGDVGFSAQKLLKELQAEKKISDRQVLEFRMECRAFLQAVVKQLQVKSPLKYGLTKNISTFNPIQMDDASKRESNKTMFHSIVYKLTQTGRFRECDADDAMSWYSNFIDNVATKCLADFAAFGTATARVDSLFYSHMATDSSYNKLCKTAVTSFS